MYVCLNIRALSFKLFSTAVCTFCCVFSGISAAGGYTGEQGESPRFVRDIDRTWTDVGTNKRLTMIQRGYLIACLRGQSKRLGASVGGGHDGDV